VSDVQKFDNPPQGKDVLYLDTGTEGSWNLADQKLGFYKGKNEVLGIRERSFGCIAGQIFNAGKETDDDTLISSAELGGLRQPSFELCQTKMYYD